VIALANLKQLYQAVGNRVSVVLVSATDFGMQNGPLVSPTSYRALYKPFHKQLNDWIHQHTQWKTFAHSCGSVTAFLEDFVEAGFDILNPVQCSAKDMDASMLKQRFGDRLTFWGGGIDTQFALPFGTAEQVRDQVRDRVRIFAPGGGFVFNSIHNIQAMVLTENLIAMMRSAVSCHFQTGFEYLSIAGYNS
jgi:uroporphyrinogen-III decarboxylase